MNELKLDTELLIKNFLKHVLQVPSRKDIEAFNQRLQRLENVISRKYPNTSPARNAQKRKPKLKINKCDLVLNAIPNEPGTAADFKTIKKVSGLEEKQVRNCIYRLEKLGRIRRVRRGFYSRNC